MKVQTYNKRYSQLVTLIHNHPHREELLQIMAEQVTDDTEIIAETA